VGLEAQVASKAKQLELITGELTGVQELFDKRLVPIARLPDGIIHHYAPLAVIGLAGKTVSVRSGCRMALQAPLKTMSAP